MKNSITLFYKKNFFLIVFLFVFYVSNSQHVFTQIGGVGTVYYETANNINYNGNITINAGVHVVLTGNWKMDPGTRIVINNQGMLTIKDNGSITNSLTLNSNVNNEWRGIEVRGNANSDQTLADQIENPNWSFVNNWTQLDFGAFVMSGSGANIPSISGSTNGVISGASQPTMPFISNLIQGGVIRINGGIISNCSRISVGFCSHRKKRMSSISNCVITNSNQYFYLTTNQKNNLNSTFIKILSSTSKNTWDGALRISNVLISLVTGTLPKYTGIQSFDPIRVENNCRFLGLTKGIELQITSALNNGFTYINNSFFNNCKTGIEATGVQNYFRVGYNEFRFCDQEAIVIRGILNGYYHVNNFIDNDEVAFRANGSGTGYNVLLGNTFTREKRGLKLEKDNPNFYTYCNSFFGNTSTMSDIERSSGTWVNQRGGCPNNNVITYLPSNTFTDWRLATPSFYNIYNGPTSSNNVYYYVASQGGGYDPIITNNIKFFKSYCGNGAEDCQIGNAEAIVDKSLEDVIIGYTVYKNQIDSLSGLIFPTADDLNELKVLQSEIMPYLFFAFNKYIENNQTTEALTLLANDSSIYSKKMLCDYYISIDSLSEASNIVSTLIALNSSEQEIIDFCELYPIIISALQAEDYWQYLKVYKASIQTIADRGQTFYSIQAQGIYNYQSLIFDYENDNDSEFTMYVEPYPMPEPEVINYETEDSTENNSPSVTISINPNPVTETFMASIVNNSNTETFTIKITDVYGIIKYSSLITIMQNQTQNIPIDFSNEISGVYNAKVELNGSVLNSILFIKQ